MKSILLIYFVIIVLCWTMNPFIKKIILKKNKMTTDEYFVINHFVITALLIGYFIYLFKRKRCDTKCLYKLNKLDYLYILLAALTSILAARLLLTLIKEKNVSYIVAHLQPIVILTTFLIGYFFFTEKMTKYKILGGIFVILGIILLNKK